MTDDLEPYVPEIVPDKIYGPDEWRPYSDPIPEPPDDAEAWTPRGYASFAEYVTAIMTALENLQPVTHRAGNDIHVGEAVFYGTTGDGSVPPPRVCLDQGYRLPDEFLREAQDAVQARMRASTVYSHRVTNPSDIWKGVYDG
jgi:hypothetical protein